jgi:high-affinity iron transporter
MRDFFAGLVAGLAAAAAMAALWGRYGHRVNLARFLQVTAAFLLLFVVQLAIYAFHELTEAGVLPLDNEYWHVATEPYGPEGIYGHWLSYGLVAVPFVWLAIASLAPRLRPPRSAGAN